MPIEAIALQMTPKLGLKGAVHLLERFGDARSIFAASYDELIEEGELRDDIARAILSREGFAAAEREMAYCQKHDIRPIASTDADFPPLLREINDYPAVIYLRGAIDALHGKCIAMVGTRHATPYGEEQCRRLVHEMAERIPDAVIVSGLAFGIDAAAHRASLEANLRTVAVLANALPDVSPATHRSLARTIVDRGGALITEQHSQCKQRGTFYLARNRIIAGLASGTIVVESPAWGGSLNTAHHADGYGRTVMALPGRATDPASEGTNHLIRTHKAQLVCSAADIIEELAWDLGEHPQLHREQPAEERLTAEERQLLDCFTDQDPTTTEELLLRSKFDAGMLTALLVGLELAGKIRLLPGNRYMKLCN